MRGNIRSLIVTGLTSCPLLYRHIEIVLNVPASQGIPKLRFKNMVPKTFKISQRSLVPVVEVEQHCLKFFESSRYQQYTTSNQQHNKRSPNNFRQR